MENVRSPVEPDIKARVRDFWDRDPCGNVYAEGGSLAEQLEAQARTRYAIEPHIFAFARFPDAAGLAVLEVGVGMGADHLEWARAGPRRLVGIDLTRNAVTATRQRVQLHGFDSRLLVADAESLPFASGSFDMVYSYGVLHHTPDTGRAVAEVHRVLRRGGRARVMLYQRRSLVGLMLWTRYALLAGRPFRSLRDIYAHQLESPGTQAFDRAETAKMFADFSSVTVDVQFSVGDLLLGAAGQRHQGALLQWARTLWPRWFIRRTLRRRGLLLLIEAVK